MKSIAAVLISAALLTPAAHAANSVFDPPLDTVKRTLPATKDDSETTLTCLYYPRFMVKQVDEGEIGATQLSMLPINGATKPPCRRENAPAEKVVNPIDWSGYFKGVKGDYIFFDADDGVNGGLGFAILSIEAKKLFEDSAVGDLEGVALDSGSLALRYKRSFSGDCSVPKTGAGCWAKIAAAAGLDVAAKPDCVSGYRQAKKEMAKARCDEDKKLGPACIAAALKELDAQQWDEAPSVIIYEAEAVVSADKRSTKALGPALSCHPSD